MYARNQVVSILGLLQTPEGHLSAGNVFLGVFQIFKLGHLLDTDAIDFSYS